MSPRGGRPPERGDEGELFAAHHERLVRRVQYDAGCNRETAEDAVATAWGRLLEHQPDRDRVVAWLRLVARREAITLGQRRSELSAGRDLEGNLREPADPREGQRAVEERLEARQLLGELSERQRELVGLRGVGLSYREIAAETGITYRAVDRELRRADARIVAAREGLTAPVGAERRRVLEGLVDRRPKYLDRELGRRPPAAREGRVAWEDAAIAIHGYRSEYGVRSHTSALGERPEPGVKQAAYDAAAGQVAAARGVLERARERGRHRGLER